MTNIEQTDDVYRDIVTRLFNLTDPVEIEKRARDLERLVSEELDKEIAALTPFPRFEVVPEVTPGSLTGIVMIVVIAFLSLAIFYVYGAR